LISFNTVQKGDYGMTGFNLKESFLSFLSSDRVPIFKRISISAFTESANTVAQSLIPSSISFPSEFLVQAVTYRNEETIVPSKLIRELSLSDRLLPAPTSEDENLEQDTKQYVVRRLEVSEIASKMARAAIATGTLTDPFGVKTNFIALSSSEAGPYILSIQGSFTGSGGETLSFIFHADGAALAGSFNESSFEDNSVEGCILRLQPLSSRSPQVEEAEFSSLKSLNVVANPEEISIISRGEGRVNNEEMLIRVSIIIRFDVITLEIITDTSSEPIFIGSAPRERVNAMLAGGLIPQQEGKIIIVDRESGEEIRQFPVNNRLSGSAWDGEFLWQNVWPDGNLLKVDIRDGGGIVEDISLPNQERLINAITFDGNSILRVACKQNIMLEAGGTFIDIFDKNDNSFTERRERPHIMSGGISSSLNGLYGVVSGIDQTPVSSDTAIILLDKDSGTIKETIIFPKNFFLEDIHHESDTSILLSVTEGLASLSIPKIAVYQLILQ
jgi:hypothetical protein